MQRMEIANIDTTHDNTDDVL